MKARIYPAWKTHGSDFTRSHRRVLSAAPNGAPVVVKQLYGVVGRAIDISSIPLSLPGNPACHDYCLQAACTMKAPAIAAAGTEERYRGCGHGKVEGGGEGAV